jgi:tetratricopeptide (TPR) repeat protein
MRTTVRVALAVGCVIAALTGIYGAQQESENSYSEEELISLLRSGIPADILVSHVNEWGINFNPDEPALARLEKEGAPPALLNAIRSAGRGRAAKSVAKPETVQPAPPPSRAKPPTEGELAHPTPPPHEAKPSTNAAAPPPPSPPSPPTKPAVTAPAEDPQALQAERHLKRSQLKEHEKDFEGALAELRDAGDARPQWGEVYYQRGLVLADLHRYGEAAEEWKKYLALAGPEADVKTVQEKIVEWGSRGEQDTTTRLLRSEASQNLMDYNTGRALAAAQELVNTQPSLENLLLLAQAYWMKRDYESLSKTASRALTLDGNSPQATLYKGAAELGQGNYRSALFTIRQGLRLDPKSTFGYELSCDVLRLEGDYKYARIQCLRALEINPQSGFAHNRLGWMLWDQKHYAESLAELTRAAEAEPGNAYWQSDLAYALVARGNVKGAAAAALEALRQDPTCPYSHDALGLVLEAQGKVSQAILEFKEAIRLTPVKHPDFVAHLNEAMMKAKGAK